MKPKRLFLLVLLFTVICAAVLDAQGALTLEQARACALANSRTLRKALLSVDSALLAEKLRGYAFLPSISANTGATISYPATTSSGTSSAPTTFANALQGTIGISLSQTIYNGGKSSVLSEIDALATGIARKEARNEYFSVLKNVDAAFFGVGEAQASVEAAQKDLEAARSHLSLAEAKLQANMIALYAYLQAQATEAAKETALIQSEGKLSVADATLASLTGVAAQQLHAGIDSEDNENLIHRMSAFTALQTGKLIDAVRHCAAENNPSLSEAALASRKAKRAIDAAAADYLPTLSASFSPGLSVGAIQGFVADGSISLSASISLDFWTTNANVENSKVAARQADLDGEETLRTLTLDIQSAVYDCTSSAQSATSSKKALEYAESNYDSVFESYKLGAASTADLLDAESQVSTDRAALISARYTFLTSFSALRTLAGYETETQLTAIVP
ncbi:MAG: TolC family protein [Spirochaetia bacterium]